MKRVTCFLLAILMLLGSTASNLLLTGYPDAAGQHSAGGCADCDTLS